MTLPHQPWFSAAVPAPDTDVKRAYEYASHDIDCQYEIFNEHAKYYRATMSGLGMRIADFLSNPATVRRHLSGSKNYASFAPLVLASAAPVPDATLNAVLSRRRSQPRFGQPLGAAELAALLQGALASNFRTSPSIAPELVMHRKPYPSGGGLYPVEFYVALLNVEGVTPCLAHYDSIGNSLRIVREEVGATAINAVMSMPFAEGDLPGAVIFLTGVFQRSTNKYGSKGYKFALIEAGAAGQTLQLLATALGLNSLFWSSFFDDEVERLLGIDGVTESVITTLLVGRG